MLDELEVLYRERLQAYTRVAAAIAGDEESGGDAVQDAFAQAVRKRRRFRGEGARRASRQRMRHSRVW
jgi:DNA-directed RNA polymerase specialized sigma24 family protein